jgi:hypothetical protein
VDKSAFCYKKALLPFKQRILPTTNGDIGLNSREFTVYYRAINQIPWTKGG